jgi:hypothetical protein
VYETVRVIFVMDVVLYSMLQKDITDYKYYICEVNLGVTRFEVFTVVEIQDEDF